MIGNLPTSKTQGIFIGLVELKGTAESEQTLRSFLAEETCVLYSYTVSEEWRREVEEEYEDDQGQRCTRTRIESGWTNVASGGEETPFYLQDDTGVVLIRPNGAEVHSKTFYSDTCTPGHPFYYGKGPRGAIMDSTFVRQFSENGIPLHHPLFVVGQAREREDVVAPELAHEQTAPLLLTVETEDQLLSRMGWFLHGLNVLGMGLAAGAAVLLSGVPQVWWPAAVVGGSIYLTLAFITWFILVYNMLIDVRNRMRQGWSSLEVQLKRRHDLIPSIVAAVEALRSHEADVQSGLATLRAETAAGAGLSTEARHRGLTNTLQTLGERYPDLKASAAFGQLQAQLVDTEQRIALARAYFNDIATAYNTRLEIVPDGWIARLFGHGHQPLLAVEDFERAPIQVDLAK